MSDQVTVRVLFSPNMYRSHGRVEDHVFPNVPRVGEALFDADGSTWVVEKVGYHVPGGEAVYPTIEVAEYEVGEAPSGFYDSMKVGVYPR